MTEPTEAQRQYGQARVRGDDPDEAARATSISPEERDAVDESLESQGY